MSEPTVVVMCAVTLDGRLAPGAGASSRIYGKHIPSHFTKELMQLREEVDAIIVGSGTVIADDSRLVPESGRELIRLVADTSGRISTDYTVLDDDRPTIVGVAKDTPSSFTETVEDIQNKCAVTLGESRIDPARTVEHLGELGAETILLEGGGRLIHSFLDAERIDEMRILYMPLFAGDEDATSLTTGDESLFGKASLNVTRTEQVESFTLLCGDVEY